MIAPSCLIHLPTANPLLRKRGPGGVPHSSFLGKKTDPKI